MERTLRIKQASFFGIFSGVIVLVLGCSNNKNNTIPSPPANLTATAVSSSQINLSWSDTSNNESGFQIEMSIDGTNFLPRGTVSAASTSYADIGLTGGTTYYYRVRSYNAVGSSAYSNVASATPSVYVLPPSAPTNLIATLSSLTQINLTWQDTSNNEDGFKIERSLDGTNFIQIDTVVANTTNYSDYGLMRGLTYWYRVRAYNSSADSNYSNVASATIPLPEIVFAYQSPTIPAGGTAPPGIPLNGATNVPLGIVITGTSTDPTGLPLTRATFAMAVSDGTSDIPGDLEFPDTTGNSSILFIPRTANGFLDPGKTYTITASVASESYSTTVTFATVSSVGANPEAAGQGYALAIPTGSVTQPPGIGPVFEPFLQGLNIVLTVTDKQQTGTSPDSGFLQFTGGEGNTTQTALIPGGLVFSLSGNYLGPYFHVGGALSLDVSGYTLVFDKFNLYGTLADLTSFGAPGIGITDGTLLAIATCANLPPEIKSVVQNFCTDTGYLILVGSFYATPFTVTAATDINGNTLSANFVYPTDGLTGVPTTATASANIFTSPTFQACIDGNSTSVSMTIRDWTTGALVSGTSFTTVSSTPAGCSPEGTGVIIGAGFIPAAVLFASHEYRTLTVLDLSPVASVTFTTQ